MKILNKVTFKALTLNKTRTFVTIIGILLSTAMFTAVTTCVSSVQNYLFRIVVESTGEWHGVQYGATQEDLETLKNTEGVQKMTALECIGYAKVNSLNSHKPYLMVAGADEWTQDLLPIHITEGRWPENQEEILIPNHLFSNGKVELSMDETLCLSLGRRMQGGWSKGQNNPWEQEEFLKVEQEKTYRVVGFYDRLPYEAEPFTAAGYTAITVKEDAEFSKGDLFVQMKNPREVYTLFGDAENALYNSDLLRYTGMSNEGSYNRVLFGLAFILMGIILFGSVALIYNAFSISVSERTKQFGILKTIGATKKQIKRSVYFEALTLSAVGIPLGILSGILGIAVTMKCTDEMFDLIFDNVVRLHIYVSAGAVVCAAAVALLTVLVSARIPARRAMRQNPIDAVRQTGDFTMRERKLRSPRWVYKIFGFAGLLADKNFKRNRKKYRTTVFSLFVSVVLFISASSFCSYLIDATDTVTNLGEYDLSYYFSEETQKIGVEEFQTRLDDLKTVSSYIALSEHHFWVRAEEETLSRTYKEQLESQGGWQGTDEHGVPYEADQVRTRICFVDDASFFRWVKKQRLEEADYTDPLAPKAVAVNNIIYWDGEQYQTIPLFNQNEVSVQIEHIPTFLGDRQLVDYKEQEDGYYLYTYRNEKGEQETFDERDPIFQKNLAVCGWAEESPFGSTSSELMLVYPMRAKDAILGRELYETVQYRFMAVGNHRDAEAELKELLQDLELSDGYLENLRAGWESERALVSVVNVFSYGFIILISLIALANVFNTISTNISLRRREFAMLRSVGIGEKNLRKMMNYECMLYGIKGLFFGLIAAVVITFMIYQVIDGGVATEFYIPWYSVAVAVGSVFLVVFATMLYSMSKIKKEDPLSALKNENL